MLAFYIPGLVLYVKKGVFHKQVAPLGLKVVVYDFRGCVFYTQHGHELHF